MTMRRLSTVPVAVSKGTQQALPFLLSHILFCHSARDDAQLVLARDAKLQTPRGEALRLLLYLFERGEAIRLLAAG